MLLVNLREKMSKHKLKPQKKENNKESGIPTSLQKQKCIVHEEQIKGLSYICPKCKSVFCSKCLNNIILYEEKCMVCGQELKDSKSIKWLQSRAAKYYTSNERGISGIPKVNVTTLSDDIWDKFKELEISDDIIEELIDRLKYIPPEKRLQYIDTYFTVNEEFNDDF